MEYLMKDKTTKNFQESVNADWKKWAEKYFPVEEKLKNWEVELMWVLKDNR